jgi:hypothetical protein
MDKRLKLTLQQRKLVREFQAVLEEMQSENIGFIANYSENGYGLRDFRLYNMENVLEIGYYDDLMEYFGSDPDYIVDSPDLDELKELPLPKHLRDDMYVDPDANNLCDDYNDNNLHPVFLLKQ